MDNDSEGGIILTQRLKVCDGVGYMTVANKYGNFVVAVDAEDLDKVEKYIWRVRVRNGKVSYVWNRHAGMLHRLVLGVKSTDGLVDHLNRNPLDNQKSNLRVTTKAENAINSVKKSGSYTSIYKGVSYDAKRRLYRTRVFDMEFGAYPSEKEAADAYNFYVDIFYEKPCKNVVGKTDWYRNRTYRGASMFKGVAKSRDRWSAKIWDVENRRTRHLGCFDSEIEAALEFNREAIKQGLKLNQINIIDTNGSLLVERSGETFLDIYSRLYLSR